MVTGIDGRWEHWPFGKSQVGFNIERRLAQFNQGDENATRAVLWGRYIFTYGSSLYLPPIHYVEAFAHYSDNFLPFPTQKTAAGVRYDRTSTLGLHYRLNYLTPYWDPEGGFQVDGWYEGGIAQESVVGSGTIHFIFTSTRPSSSRTQQLVMWCAAGWGGLPRAKKPLMSSMPTNSGPPHLRPSKRASAVKTRSNIDWSS